MLFIFVIISILASLLLILLLDGGVPTLRNFVLRAAVIFLILVGLELIGFNDWVTQQLND